MSSDPSCTQATELAALLADIKEGDEIIASLLSYLRQMLSCFVEPSPYS